MQAGSIYYSQATGAKNIWLVIRDVWSNDGWENSRWKFPTEDTRTTTCSVWAQDFQGGTVLYKSEPNAIASYFLGYNSVRTIRLAYRTQNFPYQNDLQTAVSSWNQQRPIILKDVGLNELPDVTVLETTRTDVRWAGIYDYKPSSGSTITINSGFVQPYAPAKRAAVIAHEFGHALGLNHTCANDLMAPDDDSRGTAYTPTGLTRDLYHNKWGF